MFVGCPSHQCNITTSWINAHYIIKLVWTLFYVFCNSQFRSYSPCNDHTRYIRETIKDIKPSIPEKNVLFVYNGVFLTEQVNFQYYGVKERDVIVVIPENRNLPVGDKWANLTKDPELFREKVTSMIDPRTSREAAKLRDFQMLRLERKPRYFRKLCNCYANSPYSVKTASAHSSRSLAIARMPIIAPQKATEPSTAPLPIFWAKSEPTIPEPPQDIVTVPILTQVKSEDVSVRDD